MENKNLVDPRTYHFSETLFKYLMQKRIYKVLVVCSNYDFYMLEEDGRIDEQIFDEYVSLNLRYPPIFIQANSGEKAFHILKEEKIDLVITMLSMGTTVAFELSKEIKEAFKEIPIVVLTPFSREVRLKIKQEKLDFIDYVFSWLGHAELLLAVIKLIEDGMNAEHDVLDVGVQTILLVEDNIRFYSAYLPIMYKIIFKQSRAFMTEGLNEHKAMLRMRGRPKVLLATTYEEAIKLYSKYRENMLGIISDIRYSRNGKTDPEAGFRFFEEVRKQDKSMPFLLQSSEWENRERAALQNISFIYKYSKKLSIELRDYIFRHLAFGDFVFRTSDGQEITRAADLQSLQRKIFRIPEDSLAFHFNRNDISRWLNARALFPLAQLFKKLTLQDFGTVTFARSYLNNVISNYRRTQGRGVISKFDRDTYDEYLIFSRIGEGSLGGKARGLAFIDSFLKRHQERLNFDNVIITIPRTVVLSTDIFDEFMEKNDLYKIALSDRSDEEILSYFVEAKFPTRINDDLVAFLSVVKNPIAIRSSSLLEDSHYQPFAGIYSTYMIPKIETNPKRMLELLTIAIKSVYASVYYKSSKAYMEATSNVIAEEKMGIILQEVTGTRYGNIFYPNFSGVARSINFYPIEPEKSDEGIVRLGLGLGRIIVEGGATLRVSPRHPEKVIQLSSPEEALRSSQKHFFALDLNADSFKPSTDEGVNILKLRIKEAENDGSLKHIASTFDLHNHVIRDGTNYSGKKIITFANILKHKVFPLTDILQELLEIGQKEMNNPIEIEFAVNLDTPKDSPKIFSFLQIRPIVETSEEIEVDLTETEKEKTIIMSNSALGNGIVDDIHDIVYVKPDAFKPAETEKIAGLVDDLNRKFVKQKRNYILIGPGRWGSSDPWLGIPVKWSQISAARLIVESGLKDYRIDPSQGTHFFQNLTSFRIGYFTINPYINDGFYDVEYLNNQKAEHEDEYIRQIHFDKPVVFKIDGKNNVGVLMKEGAE